MRSVSLFISCKCMTLIDLSRSSLFILQRPKEEQSFIPLAPRSVSVVMGMEHQRVLNWFPSPVDTPIATLVSLTPPYVSIILLFPMQRINSRARSSILVPNTLSQVPRSPLSPLLVLALAPVLVKSHPPPCLPPPANLPQLLLPLTPPRRLTALRRKRKSISLVN